MRNRDDYHPRHALADPESFYEWSFENKINERYARFVGWAAIKYAKPEFFFDGAENSEDFFADVTDDTSLLLTFSHHGSAHLHDVSAGAATVFSSPFLMNRLSTLNVWAKNKYLTGRLFSPLVRPLGTVAVHPKNRYAKYDLYPTDEELAAVRESAFSHSADHLSIPGNSLAIFPAGSKGEDKARDGVGHVLERLGDRKIMGVHIEMLSDTAKKVGDVEAKNRPKNLKVIFTKPYETDPSLTAKDYVDIINERAETAPQILAV